MQLISCGSEGDTEKLQKLPFYECVRNCHKSLWSSNRRSIVAFSRSLGCEKNKTRYQELQKSPIHASDLSVKCVSPDRNKPIRAASSV